MDSKYQVDVLLLDFSKVFETVSHRTLLAHYGIQDCTLQWIYINMAQQSPSQRCSIKGSKYHIRNTSEHRPGIPDVFALHQ